MNKNRKDLTGRKFNRMLVIELDKEISTLKGESYWKCKCDCGKKHTAYGWALQSGNAKSCGCFRAETSSNNRKNLTKNNIRKIEEFDKNKDKFKKGTFDLAWSAGFFDGEGCTTINFTKFKKTTINKDRPYCSIRMSIAQVEIEPLKKFLKAVNVGRIRGPYKFTTNRQPHYQWNASGLAVITVLEKLWSHLSNVKRKQAYSKLKQYKKYLIANPPKN